MSDADKRPEDIGEEALSPRSRRWIVKTILQVGATTAIITGAPRQGTAQQQTSCNPGCTPNPCQPLSCVPMQSCAPLEGCTPQSCAPRG